MREVQEPTLIEDDGGRRNGKRYAHPAFGYVSASRCSGLTDNLYGSHVNHLGFVRLEINHSEEADDGYHRDQHPTGRRIAEVWLTESQWVGLISRMNTSGVPCTLRHYCTEKMIAAADLPSQIVGEARMHELADGQADRLDQHIDQRVEELRGIGAKLGKRDAAAFEMALNVLVGNLRANAEYARGNLTKHAEKMVAQAKTEMEAAADGLIRRLGLQSMDQLVQLSQHADGQQAIGHDKDTDA